MLIEFIKKVKVNCSNKFMVIERIKALISIEEDETSDYWLEATFDDINLRSIKNEKKRLLPEEKGYLVYGRNIKLEQFREVLNCFWTTIQIPKPILWYEDVSKAEKTKLQEQHQVDFLPDGYWFDGLMYRPPSGKGTLVHPNIKLIVENHLKEVNKEIEQYNQRVIEQLKEDEKLYPAL